MKSLAAQIMAAVSFFLLPPEIRQIIWGELTAVSLLRMAMTAKSIREDMGDNPFQVKLSRAFKIERIYYVNSFRVRLERFMNIHRFSVLRRVLYVIIKNAKISFQEICDKVNGGLNEKEKSLASAVWLDLKEFDYSTEDIKYMVDWYCQKKFLKHSGELIYEYLP